MATDMYPNRCADWDVQMQVWRDLRVLQRQDGLDDPRHAGRRLGVSDIGFHRANVEGLIRRPARARERLRAPELRLGRLNWFPCRAFRRSRPGAERSSVGERIPDDRLLGWSIRCSQSAPAPPGRLPIHE